MGKAIEITLDPRPPVVPDITGIPFGETPKKKRGRKPKQKPVNGNVRKDKPKQLKAKRTNYNTPYCFDEDMLNAAGQFVLDGSHIAWVDRLDDGAYRINVKVNEDVYARYPQNVDYMFANWMAYDLLLKSVNPDFVELVKLPVLQQQDYKKRVEVENAV